MVRMVEHTKHGTGDEDADRSNSEGRQDRRLPTIVVSPESAQQERLARMVGVLHLGYCFVGLVISLMWIFCVQRKEAMVVFAWGWFLPTLLCRPYWGGWVRSPCWRVQSVINEIKTRIDGWKPMVERLFSLTTQSNGASGNQSSYGQ